MPRFNGHARQPYPYYASNLITLLRGLESGKTHAEMADDLNATGQLSPVGNRWTPAAVSGVLARLRAHSGHHWTHALLLHLNGVFTRQQTKTLLNSL